MRHGSPCNQPLRVKARWTLIAGALNVHVLIAGNMVGYVVGLDGVKELLQIYLARGGGWFAAVALLAFTAHTHLGGSQREREERAREREREGSGVGGEAKKLR